MQGRGPAAKARDKAWLGGRWGSMCYFHCGAGGAFLAFREQLREGAVLSGCEGIQTLSWPVEPTGCD